MGVLTMNNKINRNFARVARLALLAMVFCLVETAEAYRYGFAHVDPPAGDPYLVNHFGFSWSAPIYSGYLIVRGQYIEAPYVVEQRGYGIFVNGIKVEDAVDLRTLFPIPEPPPVTEDPGLPTSITQNTPLPEALSDPMVAKMHDYWNYKQTWGDERIKEAVDYFKKLPCIRNVEQLRPDTIKVTDNSGLTINILVARTPPPPDHKPSDEVLYRFCMSTMKRYCRTLESGQLGFVGNGGIVATCGYPETAERWREKFKVMTSDLPPEEKTRRLRELGFLGAHEGVWDFPMQFRATDQLWKRLSGDWSWTNDAPARIQALTNGWRTIPPKLNSSPIAKTNTPPIMKPVPATNAPPTPIVALALATNSAPVLVKGPAKPIAAAPKPKPKSLWPLAVTLVATVSALIWIILRKRH